MITVGINLDSIEQVKEFVDAVSEYDADFDLLCGRYVVDAKSIMGVLSLDLTRPLSLNIYTDELSDPLKKDLAPYLSGEEA